VTILIGTSTKMNLTSSEAATYLDTLRPLVADLPERTVFVLLPFTSIWVARDRLERTAVGWGAQDVHPADAGAHTGDVSASMLADLGCTYVELGHHERRRDHGETDELIAAKVEAVQRWSMTAVLCVGEQERAPLDRVIEVIRRQLTAVRDADPRHLIVAYEPSWAIGTGAAPAPRSWVGSVHEAIRAELDRWHAGVVIPMIYGGSVNLEAAPALLAESAVDGLFVGRQALDPRVFAAIAHVQPGVPDVPLRS
jgi:triosephosphate isomerase